MAQHNDLGKEGEGIAMNFLLKNGYQILEQNYRYQKAEVDILARKDEILAVVEVKTRSTSEFGNPQDFVKPKQIQRLVTAVDAYVLAHNLDVEVRFDIIALIKTAKGFEIEHLEDAFYYF
ncbi:YraN family protein [Formosa haliotis]|uniref:YraN family protein n=1 Tax=Formosa haliotis TaxID=1555194 RepID=UPI0008270F6F|nr:YraN family protein [Formosa haliotis]